MNDKQKQIEEMAHIIAPCKDIKCSDCVYCNFYKYAEQIYNAGYRKQSDTVREFVEQLFAKIRPMYFSLIGRNVGEIIDELAKEYGVECRYLVQLIEYMSGQGVEVEE